MAAVARVLCVSVLLLGLATLCGVVAEPATEPVAVPVNPDDPTQEGQPGTTGVDLGKTAEAVRRSETWKLAQSIASKIQTGAVTSTTYGRAVTEFKIPLPSFPLLKVHVALTGELIQEFKPAGFLVEGEWKGGIVLDCKVFQVTLSYSKYSMLQNPDSLKQMTPYPMEGTIGAYLLHSVRTLLQRVKRLAQKGLVKLERTAEKFMASFRQARLLRNYADDLSRRFASFIQEANKQPSPQQWRRMVNVVVQGGYQRKESGRADARAKEDARSKTLHGVLATMCHTEGVKYLWRKITHLFKGTQKSPVDICQQMLGVHLNFAHAQLARTLRRRAWYKSGWNSDVAEQLVRDYLKQVREELEEMESEQGTSGPSRLQRLSKWITKYVDKADAALFKLQRRICSHDIQYTSTAMAGLGAKVTAGRFADVELEVQAGSGHAGIVDAGTGLSRVSSTSSGFAGRASFGVGGTAIDVTVRANFYPTGPYTAMLGYDRLDGDVWTYHAKVNMELPTDFGLTGMFKWSSVLRMTALKEVMSTAILSAISVGKQELKIDPEVLKAYLSSDAFGRDMYQHLHDLRSGLLFALSRFPFLKMKTAIAINLFWSKQSKNRKDADKYPRFDLENSSINIAIGADITNGFLHKSTPIDTGLTFMGYKDSDVKTFFGTGYSVTLLTLVPQLQAVVKHARSALNTGDFKGPERVQPSLTMTPEQAKKWLSGPDENGVYTLRADKRATELWVRRDGDHWLWTPYSSKQGEHWQPTSELRVRAAGHYQGRRPTRDNRLVLKALSRDK